MKLNIWFFNYFFSFTNLLIKVFNQLLLFFNRGFVFGIVFLCFSFGSVFGIVFLCFGFTLGLGDNSFFFFVVISWFSVLFQNATFVEGKINFTFFKISSCHVWTFAFRATNFRDYWPVFPDFLFDLVNCGFRFMTTDVRTTRYFSNFLARSMFCAPIVRLFHLIWSAAFFNDVAIFCKKAIENRFSAFTSFIHVVAI